MRICIAGSREFNDVDLMIKIIEKLEKLQWIVPQNQWTFVSGMAAGADLLGYELAKANNIPVMKFPANWDRHGKSAGFIRNKEMIQVSEVVICFWNGRSRGTEHMIRESKKAHKWVFTVLYEEGEVILSSPIGGLRMNLELEKIG